MHTPAHAHSHTYSHSHVLTGLCGPRDAGPTHSHTHTDATTKVHVYVWNRIVQRLVIVYLTSFMHINYIFQLFMSFLLFLSFLHAQSNMLLTS